VSAPEDKAKQIANDAMSKARADGATTVIVMVVVGNVEAYYVSYYGPSIVVSGLAEMGGEIIRKRDFQKDAQNALAEIAVKENAS